MNSVQIKSFAKINVGLLLLKRRLDGYHDILTVFQAIDLYDTLHFSRDNNSDAFSLSSSGIPIPLNENNLIHRAFRVFQENMHLGGGLEVRVEKRIPTGGGLGGGDAAPLPAGRGSRPLSARPLGRRTPADSVGGGDDRRTDMRAAG